MAFHLGAVVVLAPVSPFPFFPLPIAPALLLPEAAVVGWAVAADISFREAIDSAAVVAEAAFVVLEDVKPRAPRFDTRSEPPKPEKALGEFQRFQDGVSTDG